MRAAVLMLAACAAVSAATTTIAQSRIMAPDGKHLASGTITITATAPFLAGDGAWVEQVQQTVRLVNGAFSIRLEPNAGGTAYRVRWQLDDARPRTEYWVVPATAVGGLCGVQATRVGASWMVAGCPGDSLSWAGMTDGQWTGMTDAQWTGMVN